MCAGGNETVETVRRGGNRWRWALVGLAAIVLGAAGGTGYLVSASPASPTDRSYEVDARSFAYDPSVIRVSQGDRVTLRFASADVVHGFLLEGYGIDVTIHPLRREVEVTGPADDEPRTAQEVTFVADRPGKFRYRCSRTCGAMHPFMVGELIVEPNRLWPVSAALAGGLLVAGMLLAAARPREANGADA